MKNLKALILLLAVSFISFSCFEDHDDIPVSTEEINDFVWKGMNLFYLYKGDVPKLSDNEFGINAVENRYGQTAAYNNYLSHFENPENLFESLKHQPESVDLFSRIYPDYIALEQQFQGTTATNGMEFSLFAFNENSNSVYGVIRLVQPNSPADDALLERGDIFYGIDNTALTRNNYFQLLTQASYTINLATYEDNGTPETTDDTIVPNGENITLNKIQYTENPIYTSNTFNIGGENVGYLMYNGFIAGSENELNGVFGNFKSNNIQHLVLDLRYNPGGRVDTETYLASMITGQFTGDVFTKLIYNENFASNNVDFTFQNQLNGNSINSLNLNKLYVLTTSGSASASEGLINGLKPYIEVIQIGTATTGKTQASRTLYDSPDFSRDGVNPNHTYAMQPLIANGLNKNNEAVPSTGLPPSIGFEYQENPFNYGVLGDENEPLLALALADIENSSAKSEKIKSETPISSKEIFNSNAFQPNKGGMRID